uniref:Putative secreted protein n=1 Tax=Amblyomma triste TaxID=251400 RepID=A0A023G1P8_AMBTT
MTLIGLPPWCFVCQVDLLLCMIGSFPGTARGHHDCTTTNLLSLSLSLKLGENLFYIKALQTVSAPFCAHGATSNSEVATSGVHMCNANSTWWYPQHF